jgi:hypothetical protein
MKKHIIKRTGKKNKSPQENQPVPHDPDVYVNEHGDETEKKEQKPGIQDPDKTDPLRIDEPGKTEQEKIDDPKTDPLNPVKK